MIEIDDNTVIMRFARAIARQKELSLENYITGLILTSLMSELQNKTASHELYEELKVIMEYADSIKGDKKHIERDIIEEDK